MSLTIRSECRISVRTRPFRPFSSAFFDLTAAAFLYYVALGLEDISLPGMEKDPFA